MHVVFVWLQDLGEKDINREAFLVAFVYRLGQHSILLSFSIIKQ